jgi:hypothetical protein
VRLDQDVNELQDEVNLLRARLHLAEQALADADMMKERAIMVLGSLRESIEDLDFDMELL